MKIGFIGLGIMGKPMAGHLINNGYKIHLFDINKEAVEELSNIGGLKCESIEEVAQNSDIIFTMLPAGKHVKEVLFGESGLAKFAKPDTIIVDMSSTSLDEAKEFANKLEKLNIQFMDAPVSGGEPMALNGKLAIMVGGYEDAYQKVLPLFKIMGQTIVHVGDHGAGQVAKLANQIMVSTHLAALSEACVFASKSGIDLKKLYEVIGSGLAGSAVMDAKINTIIKGDFEPGGRIDTNYKDLGNIQSSANALGIPLPVTNLVKEIFHSEIANGNSEKDHSHIINFFEKMANHKIPKENN